MKPIQSDVYTGIDNLEVMQDAVNYNRFLLNTVRRHASPSARILDFGAGTGQFAVPLRRSFNNLLAVEPDATLRKHMQELGIAAYASATDLPPGSFDLIYSLNVLEHIPADVDALRQLHTLLKPDGTLLIYVPAFQLLYTSMDTKVGHVRRYNRVMLSRTVTEAGFAVDELSYVDSLGFFATLLFKFMDRGHGEIDRRALKLYDRAIFPMSRCLDMALHRWLGKNLLLLAHKQTPGTNTKKP